MFREKYKAAFSHVHGDRTQIDKIFDIAQESYTHKETKIYPFRYAGTLVAAVAIIIAVAVYPNFSDLFKTEEIEYNPLGVVNYGAEKTWDNTAITSGELKETTDNDDADFAQVNKSSSVNKPVTENNKTVSREENVLMDSLEVAEDVPVMANAPMLALQAVNNGVDEENAIEYAEVEEEVKYTKRASGGSSAPFVMIEESLVELGEGKVVVTSAYSRHAEIEEHLTESGISMDDYRFLMISNDDMEKIAYAEKDGIFYKFTAKGLNTEELEQFINEKL